VGSGERAPPSEPAAMTNRQPKPFRLSSEATPYSPKYTTTQQQAAEAAAFSSLVTHLRGRLDVPNIELMILGGFCRNCLAKWYLAGAWRSGLHITYDQACERVYGMPYAEWKAAHQPKATVEQLARLEATKPFHASHPKQDPPASPAASLPHTPSLSSAEALAAGMQPMGGMGGGGGMQPGAPMGGMGGMGGMRPMGGMAPMGGMGGGMGQPMGGMGSVPMGGGMGGGMSMAAPEPPAAAPAPDPFANLMGK